MQEEKEKLELKLNNYKIQINEKTKELSILNNGKESVEKRLGEIRKEEQRIREVNCGDHYFIERGTWSNGMICQDFGKIID
jgi:hypothetical protein